MINQAQANTIAAVASELRPGDWKPQQMLTLLYEHKDDPLDFATLLQVVINAAMNQQLRAPSSIWLPGKHWELPQAVKGAPKPVPCEEHTGEDAHSCRCCHSEIKTGMRPESMLGKRLAWVSEVAGEPMPASIEDAKAELEAMRGES